ncbi:helix-turn-helix domain-containing protein [Alicyclobacillaceae bacterium I2511]|nr:helix-turn-helix domain-containing protein [Alicyclobacillaceae bacterium I2511]
MLDKLGQELRAQRERLGMTLGDVEKQTKIRSHYLEALELGNWSVLPGVVYARGFVRSYAECLGLDGGQLIAEYVDKATSLEPPTDSARGGVPSPTALPESPDSPPVFSSGHSDVRNSEPQKSNGERKVHTRLDKNSWRSGRSRRGGGSVVGQAGAVVLALMVLGGAWWLFHSGSGTPVAGLSNGTMANQGTTAVNQGVAANGANGNLTNAKNGIASGISNESNPAGNAANLNSTAPPPATATVTALPFQNGTQVFDVSTRQPLSVVLKVNQGACWLQVTADGQVIDGNDTVAQAQSRTWSAQRSLQVYMGNAPAVSITVNGQPVQLPQTGSGVMTVIFQKTQS